MFTRKHNRDRNDSQNDATLTWVQGLSLDGHPFPPDTSHKPVPVLAPAPAPVRRPVVLQPSMVRSPWVVKTLTAVIDEIARQITYELAVHRYYAAADAFTAAYLCKRGWACGTH